VQAQRRKYVQVHSAAKDSMQTTFENTAAHTFAGKPTESHRLFLFSADLVAETSDTPWSAPPQWHEAGSALVEFVLAQTGPADVLVFCDGRSRSCRAKLEEMTQSMRHLTEVWVVYTPSPRLGRKVSFASDNREVILVSMPVAMSELPVRDRRVFAGAGEASTHDSSYTGVPPLPWAAMPQLIATDKAKITGRTPPTPSEPLFESALGQPLFWAERKSQAFWRQVFVDFCAKSVVDCTPGSGMAARAALDLGIQYIALAHNPEHASWLQNVVDRAALPAICASHGVLAHPDLAQGVKHHFPDVLDQLREADAAPDSMPPTA